MKWSVKTFLPIILHLAMVSICYGQNDFRPGWLVPAKGDTIHGLVQYYISNSIVTYCKFKKSKSEPVEMFIASEIKSFGYQGSKVFVSMDTSRNANYVFMENVIKGQLSLFRYGKSFYVEKDSLYKLELETNRVVDQNVLYEQQKKKYSGILNYLFSDCSNESLKKDVMQADFNEVHLARLIVNYNKCKNASFIDFKKNQKDIRLNYYIIVGASYNNFAYTSGIYPFRTDEDVRLKSITPSVGAGIKISTPRITENMTFNFEVQISDYKFNESISRDESNFHLKESYKIEYIRIKTPIGFKLDLSSASWTPFLRGGVCFNFYSNGRIRASQFKDFEVGNDTFKEDDSKLEGFRMSQLFVGTGIQFSLSNTLGGFIELRGEALGGKANQFIRVDDTVVIEGRSMNISTVSLIFGIIL